MFNAAAIRAALASIAAADQIKGPGADPPQPNEDADLLPLAVSLTTTWQRMSLPIYDISSPKQKSGEIPHTASFVFCHGLGDTGQGWADGFVPLSRAMPHVKFLFPTATERPVALNGGARMPAWYDIKMLGSRLHMDATWIEHSAQLVYSLVLVESQRLAQYGGSRRVAVGGFSQGGALSLFAAHTSAAPLGAIACLSSYLTAQPMLKAHFQPCNASTPLFMAHGDSDPMIPHALAKNSFDEISAYRNAAAEKAGLPAPKQSFKLYRGMVHGACDEEMEDLALFLREALPPLPAAAGSAKL